MGVVKADQMILNIGPQHPSTHGVFRLLLNIDGERIIDVSAYRTNSFVDDTVKVEFSPWHWMYNYSVY